MHSDSLFGVPVCGHWPTSSSVSVTSAYSIGLRIGDDRRQEAYRAH